MSIDKMKKHRKYQHFSVFLGVYNLLLFLKNMVRYMALRCGIISCRMDISECLDALFGIKGTDPQGQLFPSLCEGWDSPLGFGYVGGSIGFPAE